MRLPKQYDIRVPKNGAFTIQTNPEFIQLHGVILACAKRGTGKTCAFSNLLRLMKENNALDRLIVVSPTFSNNRHYFEGLPLDEENDIIEPQKDTAERLITILEAEGADYDRYHDELRAWEEFQKFKKGRKKLDDIDPFHLLIWDQYPNMLDDIPKPTHRYNGRKPTIAILFDDCQGSDLFKPSSKLSNLVIKHRHLGSTQHGSLGCTLLFATQSYTSNSAGLPKSIRSNLTHMMVFKTKNKKELEAIAEECAGEVDPEQFYALYNRAIQGPHDFMLIDFSKKKEHPSMFRRNFNEFLLI